MERLDQTPLFVAGCGLFIAAAVLLGSYYDLNRSEWAAWVQALGSIGAIGASVWVVNRQHRLERAAEIAEQEVKLNGAKQLVREAEKMVRRMRIAVSSRNMVPTSMEKMHAAIEGTRAAIVSYPMEVVAAGGYRLIEALTFSNTALLRCQRIAEEICECYRSYPDCPTPFVMPLLERHAKEVDKLAALMQSRALRFFPAGRISSEGEFGLNVPLE